MTLYSGYVASIIAMRQSIDSGASFFPKTKTYFSPWYWESMSSNFSCSTVNGLNLPKTAATLRARGISQVWLSPLKLGR